MGLEKFKNPFNSFSEIVKKINEIIDNIGGGGGGGFTPTQQQLDAMNSGATVNKINQIAINQSNVRNVDANKVDKEVGKQLIPDAELAQITLNKTDLTFIKQPTESSNDPTDNSLVSSIDDNAKNTVFSFAQIFNWIKSKINDTIGGSSTNSQLVSAKGVYDFVNDKIKWNYVGILSTETGSKLNVKDDWNELLLVTRIKEGSSNFNITNVIPKNGFTIGEPTGNISFVGFYWNESYKATSRLGLEGTGDSRNLKMNFANAVGWAISGYYVFKR